MSGCPKLLCPRRAAETCDMCAGRGEAAAAAAGLVRDRGPSAAAATDGARLRQLPQTGLICGSCRSPSWAPVPKAGSGEPREVAMDERVGKQGSVTAAFRSEETHPPCW